MQVGRGLLIFRKIFSIIYLMSFIFLKLYDHFSLARLILAFLQSHKTIFCYTFLILLKCIF